MSILFLMLVYHGAAPPVQIVSYRFNPALLRYLFMKQRDAAP